MHYRFILISPVCLLQIKIQIRVKNVKTYNKITHNKKKPNGSTTYCEKEKIQNLLVLKKIKCLFNINKLDKS